MNGCFFPIDEKVTQIFDTKQTLGDSERVIRGPCYKYLIDNTCLSTSGNSIKPVESSVTKLVSQTSVNN